MSYSMSLGETDSLHGLLFSSSIAWVWFPKCLVHKFLRFCGSLTGEKASSQTSPNTNVSFSDIRSLFMFQKVLWLLPVISLKVRLRFSSSGCDLHPQHVFRSISCACMTMYNRDWDPASTKTEDERSFRRKVSAKALNQFVQSKWGASALEDGISLS